MVSKQYNYSGENGLTSVRMLFAIPQIQENILFIGRAGTSLNENIIQKLERYYLKLSAKNIMLNVFAQEIATGIPNKDVFFRLKQFRIQAYPFYTKWTERVEERTTDFKCLDDLINEIKINSYHYKNK